MGHPLDDDDDDGNNGKDAAAFPRETTTGTRPTNALYKTHIQQ